MSIRPEAALNCTLGTHCKWARRLALLAKIGLAAGQHFLPPAPCHRHGSGRRFWHCRGTCRWGCKQGIGGGAAMGCCCCCCCWHCCVAVAIACTTNICTNSRGCSCAGPCTVHLHHFQAAFCTHGTPSCAFAAFGPKTFLFGACKHVFGTAMGQAAHAHGKLLQNLVRKHHAMATMPCPKRLRPKAQCLACNGSYGVLFHLWCFGPIFSVLQLHV